MPPTLRALWSVFVGPGFCHMASLQVAPEHSYAFYKNLMGTAKATQALGLFEVDFMNFNYVLYQVWASSVAQRPAMRQRYPPQDFIHTEGAHQMWMDGMAQAAQELSIPIQYCMSLVQQIMNTVKHASITTARCSNDGGLDVEGCATASLLLSALGLAPFKDNARTDSGGLCLQQMAVSVYTKGPVGLGDKLGRTDFDVVRPAIRPDGMILAPSTSALPIDRHYAGPDGGKVVFVASTE